MLRGLSLVVPAFDEQSRLPATLREASRMLPRIAAAAEILVVDDGSRDATAAVARQVDAAVPVRVLSQRVNRGKGAAVARGVQAATYGLIAITDADNPYALDVLATMGGAVEAGRCEIAIGARDLPGSTVNRGYGWLRRSAGQALSGLTWLLLGLPIRDSQCGLKLFRADVARELFALRRIPGFGFDFEVLALALARGRRIERFPVHLTHHDDSRLRLIRDGTRMLRDLFALRRRLRRGAWRGEVSNVAEGCPCCSDQGFHEQVERSGWRMVECEGCGLWYLRPVPSAAELLALYDADYFRSSSANEFGYADYGRRADAELRRETFRRRLDALGRRARGERMVDVGGGLGFMADVARERFAERWVVEPSVWAASQVAPDHHVVKAAWEQAALPAGGFDLISMQDVLEHLPRPGDALARALAALRPGGYFLVVTPDRMSWLGRLSGESWLSVKLPEHVVLFTRTRLAALLRQVGFEMVSIRPARQVVSIGFLVARAGFARALLERVVPGSVRALRLAVPTGSVEIVATRPV